MKNPILFVSSCVYAKLRFNWIVDSVLSLAITYISSHTWWYFSLEKITICQLLLLVCWLRALNDWKGFFMRNQREGIFRFFNFCETDDDVYMTHIYLSRVPRAHHAYFSDIFVIFPRRTCCHRQWEISRNFIKMKVKEILFSTLNISIC